MKLDVIHTARYKRQAARLADGVNKLLLVWRYPALRRFHLDCQKPASLRNAADDVGNAAVVRGVYDPSRFAMSPLLVAWLMARKRLRETGAFSVCAYVSKVGKPRSLR
jgi:hypothetical protein